MMATGGGRNPVLAGAIADGRRLVRHAHLVALAVAVAAGVLVAGAGSGSRAVVQSYRAPWTPAPTDPGGQAPGGTSAVLVTVPDVVGEPEDSAIEQLEDEGFAVETQAVAVEDVEPAVVVEQAPDAGSEAPAGSTVTLSVAGQPEEGVTVPTVIGLSEPEARARIQEVGLEVVDVVPEGSSDVPAGFVIRSDPAGGTTVDPGSGVVLVVSSGSPDVVVD